MRPTPTRDATFSFGLFTVGWQLRDVVGEATPFGDSIEHVHWGKDLGAECGERRGTLIGCGMSTVALGTRIMHIRGVYDALVTARVDGATRLDVAGDDAVLGSADRLVG